MGQKSIIKLFPQSVLYAKCTSSSSSSFLKFKGGTEIIEIILHFYVKNKRELHCIVGYSFTHIVLWLHIDILSYMGKICKVYILHAAQTFRM